jgi:amino acid transporter
MAETKKKMNVVQLTFMVAVNMMGSGIIMLPANMAGVGAISLLSWIVTALGSMASFSVLKMDVRCCARRDAGTSLKS